MGGSERGCSVLGGEPPLPQAVPDHVGEPQLLHIPAAHPLGRARSNHRKLLWVDQLFSCGWLDLSRSAARRSPAGHDLLGGRPALVRRPRLHECGCRDRRLQFLVRAHLPAQRLRAPYSRIPQVRRRDRHHSRRRGRRGHRPILPRRGKPQHRSHDAAFSSRERGAARQLTSARQPSRLFGCRVLLCV